MRVLRVLYTLVFAVGVGAASVLGAGKDVRTLIGHTGLVRSVAFNPAGTMLASGSRDSTIKVWDVGSGDVLVTLSRHRGMVRSVAFSPDGGLLASGGVDGTVRLWEVGTWTELRRFDHPDEVNSVAFSPDGVLLATACDDRRVRLWNIAEGKEVLVLSGHDDLVWSVSFSPDGQWIASGSEDGTAKLWDVRTGRSLKTLVHTFGGGRVPVNTVAFSPDGAVIATGSDANIVELWNVSTGARVREKPLEGHQARIWAVSFSPDGKWLASGSEDATAILWTWSTGRKVHTLEGHSATVFSVAFSPDGAILATGSGDGTIRLWPVPPAPVEVPPAAVLAWIPCTNEANEYANVTAVLGFEPAVTRTRDPDTLTSLLDGVDVLLIPEQEKCPQPELARLGAASAKALVSFLERGGTIIGMTYARGADDILRGAGILPGLDDSVDATGDLVTVIAPEHPLAINVSPRFIAEDGSTGFSGVSAKAVVVVKHPSGEPVVFVEEIGTGTVIMLGFDFYSYNADMAEILRNAVKIAGAQRGMMVQPAQVRVDGKPVTLDARGQLALIRPGSRAGDPILFEFPVRCPDRSVPAGVTLKLIGAEGTSVQTVALSRKNATWFGLCSVPLPSDGRLFDIVVDVQCAGGSVEQTIGVLTLVEPTGHVFEDTDGDGLFNPAVDRPIAGAEVTLEMLVEGEWVRVNPEPAPVWRGIANWPGIYPRANPQRSNPNGYYGWEVPEGEYRVRVTALGYETKTSEPATVPPGLAKLDLPLVRVSLTLLLQDEPPWNGDVVADALTRLGIPFERRGSADLASLDLSLYSHIIVPSVQPGAFYDVLATHVGLLETFVRGGGVLQFHAATYGESALLPGGVTCTLSPADPNTVALPDHPVVKGVPSPFKGNYASHGYFTDLPPAASVITVNPDGKATTAEYPLGSGFVLATAVTVEWGVIRGHPHAPMLENLILYARSLVSRGGKR